ncbi:hypothetical protein [Streptomyces liliifuscus]|uniref:Uncharacterized protein n=1 Tax=Streptomyces liliifuscus TaxID=2797636 RepID=A0A7T7L2B2_9ACTN|nr:hypothetical protein [Streptomyces liliifuscus]QQM45171.1 hypothetical protein JEQ17_41070 [Streptomyces liliifuscus]
MAGKTWKPGDAKKFARDAKLGVTYYTRNEHARNLGPYEDTYTYSEHVFDYRRPITGTPASGSMDAVQLCQNFGPVYDRPPAGVRPLAGPGRQVGSPLGDDHRGILDEDEIRGLEKRVGDTVKPYGRRV